ncbi:unnamed protein product [Brassica rapa]|uniref:Uncharacterized protein n=1 Tax=Brassica campestris TaxID=3711 RepID=A0A8D9GL63_BRACM|nr:unnamed protein product [Brassica rapa]
MSTGEKFELGVALKGKRMCVTTNKGSSYQGILEQITDCACHGASLLLRDGTMQYYLAFSDIKEMKEEVNIDNEIVYV